REQQRSDLLELARGREVLFGGAPLGRGERETVVGFRARLSERTARHLRAGARRFEQRAVARERGAQAAREVYVAGNVDERLILADGVVGDVTLHARLAPRQSQRRRGVDVIEGRGHLRQEGCACLPHVLLRNALVQLRLPQT